jgi:hypothetical protein
MVTTGDLSRNSIPKRLNIGSKKTVNHLDNDKLTKLALMQFEKDKEEKGYAKYSDVLEKIRSKMK